MAITSVLAHPAGNALPTVIGPRFESRIGQVNWLGLWTLYVKEVRRFLNVYMQTIFSPVVSTLLFLAIFALAMARANTEIWGVSYTVFLTPGLIMMAMTQNAFANTSSSLTISKIQGNIVDMLMPPLSALELTLGHALAGVTRALVVGVSVGLATAIFVPLPMAFPGYLLFHGFMGSLMLALLGLLGGIWSEKFDHLAAVTNFIILPASFLSGTFYSASYLPEPWGAIAHFNPFFYMIDGFRYGFIGHSDTAPLFGAGILTLVCLTLGWLCWHLFTIGYRLKT